MTVPDLESERATLARALSARDRLARLRADETWRERYLKGDTQAQAEHAALVQALADGTSVARAYAYGAPRDGESPNTTSTPGNAEPTP